MDAQRDRSDSSAKTTAHSDDDVGDSDYNGDNDIDRCTSLSPSLPLSPSLSHSLSSVSVYRSLSHARTPPSNSVSFDISLSRHLATITTDTTTDPNKLENQY